MILTQKASIEALAVHTGLICLINAAHITIDKLTPAQAILRTQIRKCEVNVRNGKVKWMRMIPLEIPADKFRSGFRQDWGPALQPGWCDDHGSPK